METEVVPWDRLFARRDVPCMVVSRRGTALRRRNQIVVLADGHAAATGTVEALPRTSGEIHRPWHCARDEPAGVAAPALWEGRG